VTGSANGCRLTRPCIVSYKAHRSQIAHFDMHHLVFGVNFQILTVSLTSLVSIHLLIHLSTHLSHHPHSHHPSLLHSFTPGLNSTFSTNPSRLSHLDFFYLLDWLHDDRTGRDGMSLIILCIFLVSHFNVLFIPCGRLSWLPLSFLLYVKYTLSYRTKVQAVSTRNFAIANRSRVCRRKNVIAFWQ